MKSRGTTDLSFVCAVNKPFGWSSHDVVNKIRSITGERRVGHAGTLDPRATGVLVVMVGPATRLSSYLSAKEKTYEVTITFGASTSTDDAEGEVVETAPIPPEVSDTEFARAYIAGFLGTHDQRPPVYSAISIEGKRAYERARQGQLFELPEREITIYDASLVDVRVDSNAQGERECSWIVQMNVSKGTYMRSIARDIGKDVGSCAYMSALTRVSSGKVDLSNSFSLEALEEAAPNFYPVALDPVAALGVRYALVDEDSAYRHGASYTQAALQLKDAPLPHASYQHLCMSAQRDSHEQPHDGELIGIVCRNELKALYRFDGRSGRYKADCVLSQGVYRGSDL